MTELKHSRLYSEELGIALACADDKEYFKWFLASLLYGGHISESIARHTYRAFVAHDLLTPEKILEAGWDFLVYPIMREGGYVRYDERKSEQILRDCEKLLQDYNGSLSKLHDTAEDAHDLEQRLLQFYGVGPVTLNILLRELRPYWRKANPEPLPIVQELGYELGIDIDRLNHKTITFCRMEAGLVRLRKKLSAVA